MTRENMKMKGARHWGLLIISLILPFAESRAQVGLNIDSSTQTKKLVEDLENIKSDADLRKLFDSERARTSSDAVVATKQNDGVRLVSLPPNLNWNKAKAKGGMTKLEVAPDGTMYALINGKVHLAVANKKGAFLNQEGAFIGDWKAMNPKQKGFTQDFQVRNIDGLNTVFTKSELKAKKQPVKSVISRDGKTLAVLDRFDEFQVDGNGQLYVRTVDRNGNTPLDTISRVSTDGKLETLYRILPAKESHIHTKTVQETYYDWWKDEWRTRHVPKTYTEDHQIGVTRFSVVNNQVFWQQHGVVYMGQEDGSAKAVFGVGAGDRGPEVDSREQTRFYYNWWTDDSGIYSDHQMTIVTNPKAGEVKSFRLDSAGNFFALTKDSVVFVNGKPIGSVHQSVSDLSVDDSGYIYPLMDSGRVFKLKAAETQPAS